MFLFFLNNLKSIFGSIMLFISIILLRKNNKLKSDNIFLVKKKMELEVKNQIQQEVISAVEKIEYSNDINDNIKRMRKNQL